MERAKRTLWLLTVGCVLATLLNPYHVRIYFVVLEYATQPGPFRFVNELKALEFREISDWLMLALAATATFALGRRQRLSSFDVLLLAAAAFLRISGAARSVVPRSRIPGDPDGTARRRGRVLGAIQHELAARGVRPRCRLAPDSGDLALAPPHLRASGERRRGSFPVEAAKLVRERAIPARCSTTSIGVAISCGACPIIRSWSTAAPTCTATSA